MVRGGDRDKVLVAGSPLPPLVRSFFFFLFSIVPLFVQASPDGQAGRDLARAKRREEKKAEKKEKKKRNKERKKKKKKPQKGPKRQRPGVLPSGRNTPCTKDRYAR